MKLCPKHNQPFMRGMRWDALSFAELEERLVPVLQNLAKGELIPEEQPYAAEVISETVKRLDNTVRANAASIRALSEVVFKIEEEKKEEK